MWEIRIVPLSELEALRGEQDCAPAGGLWVRGSVAGLAKPTVAIVGTRGATPYGRRLAHAFAADLGRAGCCVISGLALGIDAAAHEGALDVGALTLGVLGSGHARFFPPRNAALADRIVAGGGAVLSPFPPEQPAFPYQFLQRNGVVASLADALVVIEAPARSGALNTANWAADRIPVFAVPGDVDRAHVAGCHALIRDGAILARDAADVLEALRGTLPIEPPAPAPARAELQTAILRALADGESDVETLASKTACGPAELIAALAILELDGAVERRGTRFALLS